MDPPATITYPSTKVDVDLIVEDAPTPLNSISTKYPSRPSVLQYSKDIDLTPDAPVTNSGCPRSLSCDIQPDFAMKPQTREYVQFLTLCWFLYLDGWNDGTSGPLLPRIQRVYGVNYTVVSMIFVSGCVGCFTGALANVVLSERLGFGKVMVMGSLFQVAAYSIASAAPPFPVFVFAYLLSGIGLAVQNAQAVAYVARFKENTERKMGILMSGNVRYVSVDALAAGLVANNGQLKHWSFHYLVSLGLALINTVALVVVFRLKRQEECLARIGVQSSDPAQTSDHGHLHQIFALKNVHLLACFLLFYVGAEATMGGWTVTYIIHVRNGGVSSGYISTGFYAGMMIGRLALLWVNEKVGEYLVVFIYAICAIGLELVIWFVPSLVGNAVAVAAIGVLMGPMYPIAMNHCSRLFPRQLVTGAVGWIAGSGQAGSAVAPFIAGAIASKAGITTLQPVLVGILGVVIVLWALIPKSPQRRD